jgi:hypothetical protein
MAPTPSGPRQARTLPPPRKTSAAGVLGRHVLITAAGKPNDPLSAIVYVVHDGRPQRVPFDGDCWQADW